MFLSGALYHSLFKAYTFIWLTSEVSCISFGISYVKKEDGSHHWTGFRNVKPWEFETVTSGM